jgi:LysM repeat protein
MLAYFRFSSRVIITTVAAIAVMSAASLWLAAVVTQPISLSATIINATETAYITPAATTTISAGKVYIVKRGDTLSTISQREYGNPTCWPGIYAASESVIGSNPDVIEVGQRLHVTAACDSTVTTVTQPRVPVAQDTVVTAGSIVSYVDEVFGSSASCAVEILDHESGTSWADVSVSNPSSGAYGLPQALPGSKMASAGADWATNPLTQLRWMLGYVNSSYGGVCAAAAHDLSTGTY